jgi:branched-subunit amino acid ABC-type transport system permease component
LTGICWRVPVAFLASALVGAVLERGVIRFLYGRPLETCWPPGASRWC